MSMCRIEWRQAEQTWNNHKYVLMSSYDSKNGCVVVTLEVPADTEQVLCHGACHVALPCFYSSPEWTNRSRFVFLFYSNQLET